MNRRQPRISAIIDEIERSAHLILVDKQDIISQHLEQAQEQITQSEDIGLESRITA